MPSDEFEGVRGQRVGLSVDSNRSVVWLGCNDPEIGLGVDDLKMLLQLLTETKETTNSSQLNCVHGRGQSFCPHCNQVVGYLADRAEMGAPPPESEYVRGLRRALVVLSTTSCSDEVTGDIMADIFRRRIESEITKENK